MTVSTPVLMVDDLHVHLPISTGAVHAVRGVSFDLESREALAIVGESGAGKTTTGLALMGLLPKGSRADGSIQVHGQELLGRREKQLRAVRGNRIAMVLQDPLTALNPVQRVGHQLAEALRAHGANRRAATERGLELLGLVELPRPAETATRYPHELSGGMRQRVLIAIAVANDPDVIIADEPASSLDGTIRAQVLEVLRAAREATGAALVLITHDLGLVAGHVDRVAVMRDGQLMEVAPVDRIFAAPAHPATAALLAAVPRVEVADGRAGTEARPEAAVGRLFMSVLAGTGLVKHFPVRDGRGGSRRAVQAVSGVSLELQSEGALGLVGESGCGKSTVARLLLGLLPPTSGEVTWNNEPISRLVGPRLRARRRMIQAVSQDPFSSLDPRMRAGDIVAEPLRIHAMYPDGGHERVDRLLTTVGLGPGIRGRWPHELSGGQRQRLAIARALATNPRVLVLDEPLSSLDTTVKAALLDLLDELRERQGLAYLYISHDLAVVSRVARQVAVMYLGRIVERGPTEALYTSATHPYTRALVSAIARPDPALERARERIRLTGELPDPSDPPSGCAFRTRCPTFAELDAVDRRPCIEELPPLLDRGNGLVSACHHPG